jgi:hypothetical protein
MKRHFQAQASGLRHFGSAAKFQALLIGGLCLGSTFAKALDLTPTEKFRDQEGFKIPIVCFDSDKHAVTWQPPAGWRLSGGGTTLSLFPPNSPSAYAKLQVLSRTGAATATPQPGSSISWAKPYLPQDASELSLIAERENPFSLGPLPAREWIFNYVSQAQRFSTAIALVDLDNQERLALIVSALAKDFEPIHAAAIASMFSWRSPN